MQEQVLEYFENYFGGTLNEDTKSEDILKAIHDLIDLTEAVCDAVGFEELLSEISLSLARKAEGMRAVRTISNPSQKGIEQTAKNAFYGDQKARRLKDSGLVDAGDLKFVNNANRTLGAATELENLDTKSPYRAKQAKRSMSDDEATRDFSRRVTQAKAKFARNRREKKRMGYNPPLKQTPPPESKY